MRIRTHASGDRARMHSFSRAVLGDHARLTEIHLADDPLHQRFRAGDDRRDLKGSLQETLEKERTHGSRIVASRLRVVQSRSNCQPGGVEYLCSQFREMSGLTRLLFRM